MPRGTALPVQETAADGGAQGLYAWVQALVGAVLLIVLLFIFAVRIIGVDGSSMVPTLQNGDRLVVVNSILDHRYRQGDIVILRKSSFMPDPIVKRVIATEGQTVDIDFSTGDLSIDGVVQQEPYVKDRTHLEEGTAFPLTVPEGCIFVMGDNRNDSKDSRDPMLGAVDTRYVIGRAVFILFPGANEETRAREFSRIGVLA